MGNDTVEHATYLICEEHSVYSTVSFSYCFLCARRSRAQTYAYQKINNTLKSGDSNEPDNN